MTAPIVDRFRNGTAPRLLDRFSNGGVNVTSTVTVPPVDPLGYPAQYTDTRAVRAYAKGISAQLAAADLSLKVTDLVVYFAAIDYTPSLTDYIEVNGQMRGVLRWDAIVANGIPAIYKVYVR